MVKGVKFMSLKSGFFDAEMVAGIYDREYDSKDFAQCFNGFLNDGVVGIEETRQTTSDGFKVEEGSTSGWVRVKEGFAWVNGRWAENNGLVSLEIENDYQIGVRIDRVVLRCNYQDREFVLAVKKGEYIPSGADPDDYVPALTDNTAMKEISLAKVGVVITSSDITLTIQDDRTFAKLKVSTNSEASSVADEVAAARVGFNAEDYSSLENRLNAEASDFDGKIKTLYSDLAVNIFNVKAWSNGSISDINGTNVSSTERIKLNDYLPIYAKKVSSSVAAGRFGLYAYNTDNTYIGMWNGTSFANDGSGQFYREFVMEDFYNNLSFANYQYKLVYRISGGIVQVENVTGVFIESYLRDISKITSSLESVSSDLEILQKNEKMPLMSQADNINNSLIWEQGAISTSTGANANNSERVRTRCYIPTNANAIDMGVSSSTRGFYLLAYALDDTYIGAYKNDTDSFVKDGSETGYNTESESFDIGKFMRNYPQYRFKLSVYVRNSGSAITPSEASDWLITSNLTNPTAQIRVIQYNIGKFNMGFDHSTPKIADIGEKIANYKEFFANADADFIFMQEYTQYIDPDNIYPSDSTLFDPIYLYKSYYEHEVMMFGQHDMRRTYFTYLHTSGDNPAYAIVGEAHINGKLVAVVSGVLNSSAPSGIDHEQQGIRALTKLTNQILNRYDYAIVGMDCNCLNQTEAISFYNFMVGKGYRAGNWAYLGYKDTYNLSSQQYKAIDNVFVKGNMKIVNFNVPDVYADLASDHFPVIVDIRMS